jgi:antitoxin PrlF
MSTTITSKGQVTIPKRIRDSLRLEPGSQVDFDVNSEGDIVLRKKGSPQKAKADRFDAVIGTADIKWDTDELMALLRGDD